MPPRLIKDKQKVSLKRVGEDDLDENPEKRARNASPTPGSPSEDSGAGGAGPELAAKTPVDGELIDSEGSTHTPESTPAVKPQSTPANATGVPIPLASTKPTDPLLVIHTLGYIPEQTLVRLYKGAEYEDPNRNKVCLAGVKPATLTWGWTKNRVLCTRGLPLTVLFLGRIVRTRFFAENSVSEPDRSASIFFRFVRNGDDDMGRRLTYGKSWPESVCGKRTFEARSPTMRNNQCVLFTEIYDGTKTFGSKSKMQRLPCAAVQPKDIFLIEARVQRYDGTSTWTAGWRTTFTLMSLTKLFAAPGSAVDDPESEAEQPREASDDEVEGF